MKGLPRKLSIFTVTLLILACGRPGEGPHSSNTSPDSNSGRVEIPEKITQQKGLSTGVINPQEIDSPKKSDLPPSRSVEPHSSFVPYEIPVPIREHMRKQDPSIQESERHFELVNPYLRVDMESSRMTFTALMRIKGRPDEALKMSCGFDKTAIPIACNNMYPDDIKIAKQRRLQATAMCMNMALDEKTQKFVCSELVFDFFVVIDGKKEFQHFESKPVYVRPAQSGDDEGDLTIPPLAPPVKGKDQSRIAPSADQEEPLPQEPKTETPPPKPKKDQSRIEPEPDPVEVPSAKEDSLPAPQPVPEPIPQEPGGESASGKKDQTQVEETKPAPSPETSAEDQGMSDRDVEDALKDDQAGDALEFDGPTETPAPQADSQYSIDGVGQLKPKMGKAVRAQAYRKHTNGKLFVPNQMTKPTADGFLVRPTTAKSTSFGTDLMVELVASATRAMDAKYPGRPPVVVGDISKTGGGQLKRHKSHQTGLDADISFPSKKKRVELWDATGSPSELDVERFLFLTETLSCAEGSPVIVYFVDRAIKKRACAFAKSQGRDLRDPKSCTYKALRHMAHWPGHKNHFHMRLKCPGNPGCTPVNVMPKFSGTGCS